MEASNAIENITAPQRRLEEQVAQNTTPRRPRHDEVGRFISIEKLIEASKETYYDALATATTASSSHAPKP